VKSQPPEEDAGGTEAAAIAAPGGRAGGRYVELRGPDAARRSDAWAQPSRRQTSIRFEGEAALGVEVAKPAARRRVGAGGWEWGESAGSDYWLGGPG